MEFLSEITIRFISQQSANCLLTASQARTVWISLGSTRPAYSDRTATVLAKVESVDRRLGVYIAVHLDGATTCA